MNCFFKVTGYYKLQNAYYSISQLKGQVFPIPIKYAISEPTHTHAHSEKRTSGRAAALISVYLINQYANLLLALLLWRIVEQFAHCN